MTDALLVLAGNPRALSLDLEDAGSLLVTRDAAPIVTLVEQRVAVLTAAAGQGPAGPASGTLSYAPVTYAVTIAAYGQTVIPLPIPPSVLTDVCLVVNGVEYRAPAVAASQVSLTWSGPFDLEPTDTVFIRYR